MHDLEGPNCKICKADPTKFSSPLKAWESKRAGQIESLRLVSVELEATTKSATGSKVYDDAFWNSPHGGGKRHPKLPPSTYEVLAKWKASVGQDRPGPCGFEICTAPSQGVKFVEQANDFGDAFKDDGVYVTSECGMHAHTDARDFCYDDLLRLAMIYRAVQPALYRMVPSDRRVWEDSDERGANPPAMRIRYSPALVERLVTPTKGGVKAIFEQRSLPMVLESGTLRNPFCDDRHKGMNLALAFKLHRTVEWRMPPGTILASDMIGWARIFAKLLDFTKDAPIELAQSLVQRGWTGKSSTRKLIEILGSSRCSSFIEAKQEECS